jgi:hypothetical protein
MSAEKAEVLALWQPNTRHMGLRKLLERQPRAV